MIVCCLCPFIGRYFRSTPFGVQSWYYYKTVYDFADRLDRVAFCGYEKNFPTPDELKKQKNPVFLSEFDQKIWRYKILDQKIYENTDKTFVPPEIMDPLVRECGGSVFQAWRRIMTEPYPPLVEFYRDFLKKCAEKEPLEFIRATANDVSMSVAAAEFKVPLVHYEKGPLREPDYQETAYWDLSGVNGSTECEARLQAVGKLDWKDLELSREELLFLFCADNEKFAARIAVLPQDADAGVAGQVDDDSNVIAYSHGYSNFEALQYAEHLFPDGKVIVRRHPAARTLCAGEYDVDKSVHHFIQRVGLVICINSSVALEAVLMGKPAIVLGDSPFRNLSSQIRKGRIIPPDDLIRKLNFILLNYLVPVPAVDSLEYTRWRLSGPSEMEIRKRHLAEFLRIRGFKDLKHFRKTFQDYHPAQRKEVAGSLVTLEPVSIVQREKDYLELAGQHQELHQQHADLEKRHSSLCEQHADLEKRHAGLFQRYNDLGQEYNVLSSQSSEREQQFNDLFAQFTSLKENYHALCDRHADLERRHAGICSQHADLEKRHNVLYRQFQDSTAALLDSQNRFGIQSKLLNEFNEKFNLLLQDVQKKLPQLGQLCKQYSQLNPDRQCRKYYELWLQFITNRQDQLNTETQYRKLELHCHELTLKIQDLELLKQQFLAQINSLSGQLEALFKFSSESETDQKKSAELLKQKCDVLSEQLAQLDRHNKNLHGRYTAVELQLENLRGQNSVLQQKFDTLDHEHQEHLKQHEALLTQHNGLLQNYQHLAEVHQTLEQNHAVLKSDYARIQQVCSSLEKQHQELDAAHRNLNNENAILHGRYTAVELQLENLKGQNSVLQQKFDTLDHEHQEHLKQHEALLTQHNGLLQNYQHLAEVHQTLEQNHAVLKSDYARIQQVCSSLEKQHQELDAAHRNLNNENAVLQQVHLEQSKVLADLKSNHDQLLRDYGNLDAAHQKLNREHAVLNEKFSILNSDHDQLNGDHALLQQEYDSLTRSHAVLEYQHKELNQSHADLIGKQEETNAKYLSECGKNSELQNRLTELQKKYQALTEHAAGLEKKNRELTAEQNRICHSHAWRIGSAVVRPFQKVHLLTDKFDDPSESESKS